VALSDEYKARAFVMNGARGGNEPAPASPPRGAAGPLSKTPATRALAETTEPPSLRTASREAEVALNRPDAVVGRPAPTRASVAAPATTPVYRIRMNVVSFGNGDALASAAGTAVPGAAPADTGAEAKKDQDTAARFRRAENLGPVESL